LVTQKSSRVKPEIFREAEAQEKHSFVWGDRKFKKERWENLERGSLYLSRKGNNEIGNNKENHRKVKLQGKV